MIIPNIWKNKKCSKPPTSNVWVDIRIGIPQKSPLTGRNEVPQKDRHKPL
jgi:hypothetical protein